MKFKQTLRGVTWDMEALGCTGTVLTVRAMDHAISMPASVLEFSLWDARCKTIPDFVLSDENISLLHPWLEAKGCRWRLGALRRYARPKEHMADPRQLKLPGVE